MHVTRLANSTFTAFATAAHLFAAATPSVFAASLTPLGDLAGGGFHSTAGGISADGLTVVGSSDPNAVRWTSSGGMVSLGKLPGSESAIARGASRDGAMVVGHSYFSPEHLEAFRWTSADGMVSLGDLPGGPLISSANDVSEDGAVIVGVGYPATGFRGFRWTSADGMIELADLPGSVSLSEALGISADGAFIVGWSQSAAGAEPCL